MMNGWCLKAPDGELVPSSFHARKADVARCGFHHRGLPLLRFKDWSHRQRKGWSIVRASLAEVIG
jgi:hypothetical protein